MAHLKKVFSRCQSHAQLGTQNIEIFLSFGGFYNSVCKALSTCSRKRLVLCGRFKKLTVLPAEEHYRKVGGGQFHTVIAQR